jgi:hypothetical protein
LQIAGWAVGTPVLFKILLGSAVESKCSYGALQMRSGDAPSTMGAAPSSKVIAVDPDQALIHEDTFGCLCLQLSSGPLESVFDQSPSPGFLSAAEYFLRIPDPAK